MEARFRRVPVPVGEPTLRHLAKCTGAAEGYIEQALTLGVDAFLTGEISKQQVHLSRESDVVLLAAGHHATER